MTAGTSAPADGALTITILGNSGTYPGAGQACSGYLLRTATTAVWLDAGSGSLANLQRHVDLVDIDGVVCSHSHPDHWSELPLAYNALRYVMGRPESALPVYWTEQTATLFMAVSGHLPGPTFQSTVIDESARVRIGDIEFRFSRTDHPVETLAVRADAHGRSIAYSADTGDAWRLSSLGDGIDLAVVEATLAPHEEGVVQHLTGAQAGLQAAEAGVASLLLTHLAPGTDPASRIAEARTTFDGPIAVTEIGTTYSA